MIHRTAAQLIWDASMLSTAGLSLWRGGWAERVVGCGMVVDSVASTLYKHDWKYPQWADLSIDIVYMFVMIGVALKSRKLWPLWAAGFQLVAVVIYLARVADMRVGALATFTANVIWSYLILVVIVIGTWLHQSDRTSRPSPSPSV
jgi:hypothetical protein